MTIGFWLSAVLSGAILLWLAGFIFDFYINWNKTLPGMMILVFIYQFIESQDNDNPPKPKEGDPSEPQ